MMRLTESCQISMNNASSSLCIIHLLALCGLPFTAELSLMNAESSSHRTEVVQASLGSE